LEKAVAGLVLGISISRLDINKIDETNVMHERMAILDI
jgi:hypothetical protein